MKRYSKFVVLGVLTTAIIVGLKLSSIAQSGNEGLSIRVKLDAAAGWTTRSTARGSVLIFGNKDIAEATIPRNEFDFHVWGLRCRGDARSPAEQELEAVRYYEFVINGQALMRFNLGCDYGFHPDGIGGTPFYTKLILSRDALDFSVDDPLTIEVLLQPDDVVALVGMTD